MTDADDLPTVVEAAEDVRAGRRSALDLVESCLARIDARNPELNAFVYLDADGARRAAEGIDRAVAEGRGEQLGPLAGVPFGVKDLEDCAGMPTSHGSLLHMGEGPVERDSEHVRRLRGAGAIPLGKTASPEFGRASCRERG